MTLLEHYLYAVGGYLEKRPDRADVLAELDEHLRSKIEEREAQLGRPLTETEEKAVLSEYGDPFAVASRYGRIAPGFSFGALQIIGPAAFPAYAWALALVLTVTLIGTVIGAVADGTALLGTVRRVAIIVLMEFGVLTVIFAGIDLLLVRSKPATPVERLDPWLFWSPYAARIPRWYSIAGLTFLALVTAWWATILLLPALTFGSAADTVTLSPVGLRLYWPMLAVLAVGMAQRVANLVRPDLLWLVPGLRLLTNLAAVALLCPLLSGDPLIAVRSAIPLTAAAAALAASTEATVRGVLRGMGAYWFFNALWLLWVGIQHVRHFRSRRQANALT